MTKLLTAAALACALTVLFAPAATGNPPTLVEQVEVNRDVVIPALPETCDFPIVAHIEGTRVVKDFTDQDGNPARRPSDRRASAGWIVAGDGAGQRRAVCRTRRRPDLRDRRPPDRLPRRHVPAGDDRGNRQVRRAAGRERVPGRLRAALLGRERERAGRVLDEDSFGELRAELTLEPGLEASEDVVEARPAAVRAHHRAPSRVAAKQEPVGVAP